MNASRVAVWTFGAAVLGAWFASAAGVSRGQQSPQLQPPPAAPNPMEHLAADVESQAERLRQRLDTAPAPTTPLRNPFAFSPRTDVGTRRPRVARPAMMPTTTLQPEAPEPALTLVGIAEKHSGGTVVRTAVIAGAAGDVMMVTAGQRILGLYEVVAVSLEAVELRHVATGVARVLPLR